MTTSKSAAPLRKGEDLDGRYGKIGIPAVAAALPYQSDTKNQADVPVVQRDDARRSEDAWRAELAA